MTAAIIAYGFALAAATAGVLSILHDLDAGKLWDETAKMAPSQVRDTRRKLAQTEDDRARWCFFAALGFGVLAVAIGVMA